MLIFDFPQCVEQWTRCILCSAAPVSSRILKSNALFWLNEELRHLQNETKRKKNKVNASCLLLRLWCLLMTWNSRKKETLFFHNLSQFQNTFYFNKVWLVPHNLLNLEWTSLNMIKLLTFGRMHSSHTFICPSDCFPTKFLKLFFSLLVLIYWLS